MDRHTKKAPPPLPLPETDYPLVSATNASSDNVTNAAAAQTSRTRTAAEAQTSTFTRASPTTLFARRFPSPAARRNDGGFVSSPTSSQGQIYGRSPVSVTPTGTGSGGFRSVVSREALASAAAAGDYSHRHSFDSVAEVLAAADVQRGVTVIYPQREGSEVDLDDPESPLGGPDASLANANQDLAQVRVEGYFDSDVGVLIPNDLPKSTLLYVLTASDGRDNMFKCIQYFLQLLICFLHTPSLFSPEMQVFTGMWAEHFYRNYNTIRHGRSLFKMGRGFLNLFTAQAVASRLWTRYGDDVRISLQPVTSRMASLLLRVDRAIRVAGLSVLTDKMRVHLVIIAGARGGDDDDVDPDGMEASVAYYYSQARMRAHLKQQHRLRAEANTLLTDDVYTHVSRAEMGPRLPAAQAGGSPVSGNVSEGVSPTTAFTIGRTSSGPGGEEASFGTHTRPFYVRDVPHVAGGSSGVSSFTYQTGSFPQQQNSQNSLPSSKNANWVSRPGPFGSGSGSAGGVAGTGTVGLLAGTRQPVVVPQLGGADAAEEAFFAPINLSCNPETAAPTPDALAPLDRGSGNDEMGGQLHMDTDLGGPPTLPQTLPVHTGDPNQSDAVAEQEQANNHHDDTLNTSSNLNGSFSMEAGSSSNSTGPRRRRAGGPMSTDASLTVTDDGTQEDGPHGRKGGMEDFSACPTLSANDPLFEAMRRPSSLARVDSSPMAVTGASARRQTAAPTSAGAPAPMVSPDVSTGDPSFFYDAGELSLRHSSDSDGHRSAGELTTADGTREAELTVVGGQRAQGGLAPHTGRAPRSPAQGHSPVGADPWATALMTASLVPAAVATPSNWRKRSTQFNTLLMVLLGVRSCSAAIRRFLRDATLISSERFFNTDIIERHRPRIHRTFNYAWLVVAVIDLLLNTIRLVQPGWTKYATARQNVRCRCGCTGDDPADVVWRTSDFIARRKTDLFFPSLDLDYGAPAVSYITYFDAADPAHMMPACSHCGYLYKEVTKVSAENEPSGNKPQWLKMYEDAANVSSHSVHDIGTAAGMSNAAGGGGGGTTASGVSSGTGASRRGVFPSASGDHMSGLLESRDRGSSAAVATTFGAVEVYTETTGGEKHTVSTLYLPYLMRRVFNYIWLLRCHPNWSSTLLLQLRYSAELFLAWKYCFGGYEPYRTDGSMASILHPIGAVAGLVSASVGLLRVVESAPQ